MRSLPAYSIVISDGVHFQQAMLATQQNSKVQDGSLVANCVVVLKQYICNTVQGKKCVVPPSQLGLQ